MSVAMMTSELTHDLHAYSYEDRHGMLPCLTSAFTQSGGWVLERKTTSATTMQFRFEIQLDSIVDLYAQLVATGVEFTRATHALLTELCTCRRHVVRSGRANQVLTLSLELSFLEDVTLHSLLTTGSGME